MTKTDKIKIVETHTISAKHKAELVDLVERLQRNHFNLDYICNIDDHHDFIWKIAEDLDVPPDIVAYFLFGYFTHDLA